MIALRISQWADVARSCFDRFRREWGGGVTLVAVFGALTAFVGQRQLAYLAEGCETPVDMIRLEVTFSVSRFAEILRSAVGCTDHVVRSFITWDVIYPFCYAGLLWTVFVWTERWRRYDRDGRPDVKHIPDLRRDVAVLAPGVAALLDLVGENLPLWYASRAIQENLEAAHSPSVALAVWIGSFAALLKWLLVLFAVVEFVREFVAGPRGAVLRRSRFSVLAVALGAVPLLAIAQGQDILQRVFESDRPLVRIASAVPPVVLAALAVWYFSRKLLELRLRGDPVVREDSWYQYFAENIPRVLGIGVLALAGMAFARAGLALPRFLAVSVGGFAGALAIRRLWPALCAAIGRWPLWLGPASWKKIDGIDQRLGRLIIAALIDLLIFLPMVPGPTGYLRVAAYWCVVSAWILQLFVRFRRQAARPARIAKPRPKVHIVETISRGLKRAVVAATLVSLALLAAFTFLPVPVGRALGPLWILAIAAVNAAFIGSVSVWAGRQYGVPVVRLALVLAVMFSFWNDNHAVRVLGTGEDAVNRPAISSHFKEWQAARLQERNGTSAPVVLVAGAGGGLRAAYWTAISLALIQDQTPSFARHVFAFSGVSGGSLGGALFSALVRDIEDADVQCRVRPEREKAGWLPDTPYIACVHEFMSADFLSPVLAKLVAPDFLQWFLPIGVRAFDRSAGLEESWERSYRDTTQHNTFAEGFVALRHNARQPLHVPALFLNTTHVESGRRYLATSLVREEGSVSKHRLQDARDIIDILRSDIPLSTAVHNSARFTYVSPAGHLDAGDALENGHVVDGGYFENSGLATLREIYDVIGGSEVKPIVLFLCNDPATCYTDLPQADRDRVASTAADEILSPARALLRTRDARGTLARANLMSLPGVTFLELNVCASVREQPPEQAASERAQAAVTQGVSGATIELQNDRGRERVVSPPLGWLLSELARKWMDGALSDGHPSAQEDCYQRNMDVLRQLQHELR